MAQPQQAVAAPAVPPAGVDDATAAAAAAATPTAAAVPPAVPPPLPRSDTALDDSGGMADDWFDSLQLDFQPPDAAALEGVQGPPAQVDQRRNILSALRTAAAGGGSHWTRLQVLPELCEAHYALEVPRPGAYHTGRKVFSFLAVRRLIMSNPDGGQQAVLVSWCSEGCPCARPTQLLDVFPAGDEPLDLSAMSPEAFFGAAASHLVCEAAACLVGSDVGAQQAFAQQLEALALQEQQGRLQEHQRQAQQQLSRLEGQEGRRQQQQQPEQPGQPLQEAIAEQQRQQERLRLQQQQRLLSERQQWLDAQKRLQAQRPGLHVIQHLQDVPAPTWRTVPVGGGGYVAATQQPGALAAWGMVRKEPTGAHICLTCAEQRRFCRHCTLVAEPPSKGSARDAAIAAAQGAPRRRRRPATTREQFEERLAAVLDLSTPSGGRALTCLSRLPLPEDLSGDQDLLAMHDGYSKGVLSLGEFLPPTQDIATTVRGACMNGCW